MILEHVWRVIIAIAALVGTYIAIAVRQRRILRLLPISGNINVPSVKLSSKTAIEVNHLSPAHINIEFPWLPSSNLDVWGDSEEFVFACQLLDEKDNPIGGRSVQVHINSSKVAELTTNNQGICDIKYLFQRKGTYTIDCHFENDEEFISCSQQRKIRIVDYREEVARLFNTVKKSVMSNGMIINDQLTPRDVGATLLDTFTHVDSEKLDKFIYYVEESLYSSHHFDSQRYSDTLYNYPGNSILISH